MGADFCWVVADKSSLSWIREVSTNDLGVGFYVAPMPDQVFVLHPIFERVDGKPVEIASMNIDPDQPDDERAALRRVTWAEFAQRRDVPMIQPGQYASWSMPFAEQFDATDDGQDVWPPSEGNIDDAETRQALFEILIKHTSGGGAALATAFHWTSGPNPVDSEVLRGPLSAWQDLFSSDHVYSPQNIWPDTQEWVLHTDPDSWATAISGTSQLIEALTRSPYLEAVRLNRVT